MPAITPLPDPPSRSDPANFAARGDAFVAALEQFVDEVNALAAALGVAGPPGTVNYASGLIEQAAGVTARILSAAGEITMPKQPSFRATMTANADVTGNGDPVTAFTNTEVYDQNADFNHTTSVLTAPVTGKYWIWIGMTLQQLGVGHTSGELSLVTSNDNYPIHSGNYGNMKTAGNELTVSGGWIGFDMDAGDTASFILTVSGSTKTIDLANVRMSGGLLH